MSGPRIDPFRSEARVLGELARLHAAPIFYGRDAPRGDGRLVVVVPGLFGNDLYLQPLRTWLGRIGYKAVRSSLSINAGCPNRLRGEIEATVDRHAERTPGPIALIGHSRGGMLCWALASRLQARVSHLALLGSPAPAVVTMMRRQATMPPSAVARSSVARAGATAMRYFDPDCDVPRCGCEYLDDMRRPLHPSTRVLSILTREDPIVTPGACRVPNGQNVEVDGSHSGLAHSRAVYPHLARFLAER